MPAEPKPTARLLSLSFPMRHDSIEFGFANSTGRARRIWHGRGCSRIVVDTDRALPPAAALDEAIANFEPIAASTIQQAAASTSANRPPMSASLVAGLSAQLEALDRQREHLAQLLHSIDNAAITQ